jgi:hypothetical protein
MLINAEPCEIKTMLNPSDLSEEPEEVPSPKTQTEPEMDGGGTPPRKTAIGSASPRGPFQRPDVLITGTDDSNACVLAKTTDDGSTTVLLHLIATSNRYRQPFHDLACDLLDVALQPESATGKAFRDQSNVRQIISEYENKYPESPLTYFRLLRLQSIHGAKLYAQTNSGLLRCSVMELLGAASIPQDELQKILPILHYYVDNHLQLLLLSAKDLALHDQNAKMLSQFSPGIFFNEPMPVSQRCSVRQFLDAQGARLGTKLDLTRIVHLFARRDPIYVDFSARQVLLSIDDICNLKMIH